MPLSPGDKLGHFEVLSLLGRGGMGEVYRARDTKLKRDVALKVLPDAFARDPERMARFQREAEVLASLNHTNIAHIYGVEERALVMELVEGEAPKGPMPFDDAWHIASQIAAALEYAHDKGIIHRDLKPANIKVTPDGTVKLLDFGLAKAFTNRGEARSSDSPENSPTLTIGATEVGVILGTAAYMSPEQARGKVVDKRADIWSFGVVLYELLTGERLFKGEDTSDTLAQVLTKEPDLGKVPPKARKLLLRCLEKDPKKRLRDIGEASFLLEDAVASAPSHSRLGWAAGVLAAALAVLAGWGFLRTPPTEPKPVSRWTVPLDVPVFSAIIGGLGEAGVALSHDGTQLAYMSGGQIWVRALDQLEGKPVPGAEGRRPIFSPDGQWLAYLPSSAGAIKKIPVNGGSPTVLCQDATYFGASWGADGTIVFTGSKGLMRVAASGGKCEPVTMADSQKEIHRWPQILPGGQAVAFAISTPGDPGNAHLAVVELKSGKIQVFENTGTSVRYATSGHLLYVRGGTLFAVPFDIKRLAMAGPEAPVADGVHYNFTGGYADYTLSDSGLLVYSGEVRTKSPSTLAWMDRKGNPQPLAAPSRAYSQIHISPDGKRAVVTVDSGAPGYGDLWIYDLEQGSLSRFTSGDSNSAPVWMPDGQRIAFFSYLGKRGIFWVAADATGTPAQLLASANQIVIPTSWTPDGKTLFYQAGAPARIWAVTLGKEPLPISQSSFNERDAAVSPDGHWMAYDSDESGKSQVYAKPLPGPGAKVAISIEGGQTPLWSRDGRELFYRDPVKGQLMVAEVQPGPALKVGQPKALFALGDVPWDVAPDGRRFLVVQRQGGAPTAKLQVVMNWFEELRRKAPTDK